MGVGGEERWRGAGMGVEAFGEEIMKREEESCNDFNKICGILLLQRFSYFSNRIELYVRAKKYFFV